MRSLGLLVIGLLLVGCARPLDPPTTAPSSHPTLHGLPTGAPPRIGYVDHQEYVERGGRRTALPRRLGVSGVVPYAGGFLLADTRFFEGTLGLSLFRDGRVIDSWCSAGVPDRSGGWVTWLVAYCPESADFIRAEVHRAHPDGSAESVRRIPPRSVPRVATSPTATPIPDLPRRWFAMSTASEDRHHVLAVVVQGRWTAVVRFSPQDVAELAAPVVAYDPNLPGYVLGPGR